MFFKFFDCFFFFAKATEHRKKVHKPPLVSLRLLIEEDREREGGEEEKEKVERKRDVCLFNNPASLEKDQRADISTSEAHLLSFQNTFEI